MSKEDIRALWLSLSIRFWDEGNLRWALYCEQQIEAV